MGREGKRGKGGGKVAALKPTDTGPEHIKPEEELVSGAVQDSVNDAEVGFPSSNQKNKKGRRPKKNQTLVTPLWKKPNLTRDDVKCPICWSILLEPTTLPCNHSICMTCFSQHIEENSLCCPCCRLRISVWTRNAKKQGTLLDDKLWKRLESEFPALVEARKLGVDTDTQNIDPAAALELQREPEDHSLETSSQIMLDGTFSVRPGEVKQEYDLLYKQHQEDLELERLREEAASASFIEKLQEEENQRLSQEREMMEEEDRKLAQKIQEAMESEEANASSSKSIKAKTHRRNLMEEWIANNSFTSNNSVSPAICQNPKSRTLTGQTYKSKKSTTPSSSTTKSNKGKRRQKSESSVNSNVTRASQDMMANFLMSQNSQSLLGNEVDGSHNKTATIGNEPCSSRSIALTENLFSAFSPTKASSKMSSVSSQESASSSRTPDSIQSEVERHFKPIKSAPKTPPRRRLDGTFLPEPKLIKMTPLKATPPSKVTVHIVSPSKQVLNTLEILSRPSCATAEKWTSNDSGRASESPVEEIASLSPNSASGWMLTSTAVLHRGLNEMGCSSDDYRVTPDDVNSKKRSYDDKHGTVEESPFKKAKRRMEMELARSDSRDDEPPVVNTENQPLRFELQRIQGNGLVLIDEQDEEFLQREAEELEKLRMKREQETSDLAYALRLQKDLRSQAQAENSAKSREDRCSLRNWIQSTSSISSSRPIKKGNKSTTAKKK